MYFSCLRHFLEFIVLFENEFLLKEIWYTKYVFIRVAFRLRSEFGILFILNLPTDINLNKRLLLKVLYIYTNSTCY